MNIYFQIFYWILLLAGCIVGIIKFNRRIRGLHFLVILLGYTALSEVTKYWAAVVFRNNWVIIQIYNLVSIALYTGLFYGLIQHNKHRRIFLFSGIGIAIFCVINAFWIEELFAPARNVYMLKTLFFSVAAWVLLFQQLDLPSRVQLFKEPVFLIAISMVWFFTVSSLNFFFSPVFSKHGVTTFRINGIHLASNYVHYLAYLWAMINLKNYNNVPVDYR